MKPSTLAAIAALPAALFAVPFAHAGERDVQIRSIDFETGVFELHNCGSETIDLSQWRFCTHDEDQVRRYTAETGLVGISLTPGASLFIHTNNDAPGGNTINVSAMGGLFAAPLDQAGAFAIGLYFPDADGVVDLFDFGNPAQYGDHIQWSEGGADNLTADERSDEAELAGLWADQSQWIDVSVNTLRIDLTDTTCGLLHSPADYLVTDAGGPCNDADLAEPFGMLDFSDVVAYLTAFGTMDPAADLAPPFGSFDFTDVVAFLGAFAAGCP